MASKWNKLLNEILGLILSDLDLKYVLAVGLDAGGQEMVSNIWCTSLSQLISVHQMIMLFTIF